MADPLSILASATGVIAFAASTARTLITLTTEIRDAPEEILHVQRDVQSLSGVLQTVQDICTKANLQPEDQALVESLAEYVNLCQATMVDLKKVLQYFSSKGQGRRSPFRMISWTLRKGEIKALRERLQEGKASLNLTLLALKGIVDGKGQEEIKAEVNKVYSQLVIEFRNIENGRQVRKRVEDDISSVSNFGTDVNLPLRRYFQQLPDETNLLEVPDNNTVISWDAPTVSLLEAVQRRDRQLVSQLIANHKSLTERTTEGYTALHLCAIYNDAELAEMLIKHGADINTRDNQLRSPLQVALASESGKVGALFIQSNCSLGDTVQAIYNLARRSDEISDVMELLKTLAIRLNKSLNGPFLLQQSIKSNDTQALELFCDAGFDVNIKDSHGLPPLCHAMMQRRDQAFRILLQYKVDVNFFLDAKTKGTLDESISWHRELKDRLGYGATPLSIAVRPMNNLAWTKLLLENGANPNFVFPEDGGVLLMGICAPIYIELAKAFVKHGSNINHRNKDGYNPLYWASRCGNPELVRVLLEHGGDVNIVDNWGWTPLHLAAMDGSIEIAEIALEYGADTKLKNSGGETAADVARRHAHSRIVELIESR